ncbi:MAG: preprotein translocase subunit SecG [Pusillimonas sp.]
MEWLSSLLLAIQVISSLSIIVLVLLQQGKGADMGSSFGGGSAGSLFGATGAANFLSRTTKWAAVVFFASTIGLAFVSHRTGDSIIDSGIMQGYQAEQAPPAGSAVPQVPGAVPDASSAVPQVPGSVPDAAVPQVPNAAAVPADAGAAVPQAPASN